MSKPKILEMQGTVLYEDETEAGTTGDITLNDSAENYKRIEIFWNLNQQYYDSKNIENPNNKNFILATNTPSTAIRCWQQTNSIKNNTITRDTTYYQDIGSGRSSADFIYIYKVIGYKK